ncbi:hypothetical protein VFPPC_08376 [Pochonia chlamydosporia 170]|uniref:Uncharacterized protein n=1 Tax=Pochonia chlamydosporia 170 TaxID=1380566 RepID=A0A179FPD9_METCM|nr:hypothetical protein VFPPC_08376 [Pochonia chlamydosporia 170]OAQ66869.1 hypothetical protein VFPPC_08376 [Pochonia chlamydosporia 170]
MSTEGHHFAAPQAAGPNGAAGALPQGSGGASTTSATATAPMSSMSPASDTMMQPPSTLGKRKAETQDNERLSKRLSLLNLEQNGNKLYVPVETSHSPNTTTKLPSQPPESMELDDSKHKVYIYNLDDELSSESEDEEGKLVFLPDIEKHLRENRIPQQVLANSEGELAGMQLVLYKDPKSVIMPEDKDTRREAILNARQRTKEEQSTAPDTATTTAEDPGADEVMDVD